MKEVAELDQELTIEERNLLSVAYKNIIVSVDCCPFLVLSSRFLPFPSLPPFVHTPSLALFGR